METIRGIVTRILKDNPDSGRVFMTVQYESGEGLAVAKVGAFARNIRPGDSFVADGEWKSNTFRGKEEEIFEGKQLRPDMPTTKAGMERFLSSIFTNAKHGITPDDVAAFIEKHGVETIKKAVDTPSILLHMSRRPKECEKEILAEWESRTKGRRAISLMESSGLEQRIIERVLDAWGDLSMGRLKENPYSAVYIPRVGFGNADKVGRHLGIELLDERRLSAAIIEVLRKHQDKGSTKVSALELLDGIGDVDGIDITAINGFLADTMASRHPKFSVLKDGSDFYASLHKHFLSETTIAQRLAALLTKGRRNQLGIVQKAADRIFQRKDYKKFDAVQRAAVLMAASEPVSIITGGPGTGKSTVMAAVAELIEELDGPTLFLAAPTGKASKRLNETTERPTQTVHKLLQAKNATKSGSSTFTLNAQNPLPPGSVVVIDESSMNDSEVSAAVLSALANDGRIIFVGDIDQLPSVGPGAVLRDFLESRADGKQVVPSVRLINVYRQAEDSGIATGAAEIRQGIIPEVSSQNVGGVSFEDMDTSAIVDRIEQLVCKELPKQGYDPLKDIAVLVPQAPGAAGTWEINRRLSARLNPNGAQIPGVFRKQDDDNRMPLPRVGDRVMLTENDSDRDVMNGDVGFITGTGRTATGRPTIRIKFDCGVTAEYPASRWRNIILAYAGTIHKSQGSQYPVVIMPFASSHARMQERTLTYTGWTRAQKRLMLLGERDAFERSIETYRGNDRNTLLSSFLRGFKLTSLFINGRQDWEKIAADAQASIPKKPSPSTAAKVVSSKPNTVTAPKPSGISGMGMARAFSRPLSRPQKLTSDSSDRQTSSKPSSASVRKMAAGGLGFGRPFGGKVNAKKATQLDDNSAPSKTSSTPASQDKQSPSQTPVTKKPPLRFSGFGRPIRAKMQAEKADATETTPKR